MSNQQVGPVFERVIQEVCDASQVDFEESGVDQKTLLDLRETWQKKLSLVNVAHFPWDPPPPQPTPQAAAQLPQATVPSNAPRLPPPQHVLPPASVPQSVPAPSMPAQAPAPIPGQIPPVGAAQAQPRIKTEPGTVASPGMPPMNNPIQMNQNPNAARDRAISNIQQKYGQSAAHSVSQLQAQGPHGYPQVHPPTNGQVPQIKQEPGYPSLGNGQTDGGREDPLTDWKAEVARRREAAQNGQSDRMLREYLNQQMNAFEGGGLLLPLNEHKIPSASSRRAARVAREAAPESSSSAAAAAPRIPGQYDGGEEEDEDAINSDLDDPDDLVGEDQDAEEGDGQVMLCTYDKVQRVKNKWKCTLKDGILTSNGKEYVFHKGQGEFEW